MKINVVFFAGLREKKGEGQSLVTLNNRATINTLMETFDGFFDGMTVLCSLNHQYVDKTAALKDGDEVAFFPPVTGG